MDQYITVVRFMRTRPYLEIPCIVEYLSKKRHKRDGRGRNHP
jgi:hypothetical protein